VPNTTLAPSAWRQEDNGVLLLATRCGRCDTETFPPAPACPRCWERSDLTTVPLPQHGTVHAFTVTHVPAAGIEAPYAVGFVDFANGIRVCGRLQKWADIQVGDTVEAVPGVLRDGPDGELRGWLFQRAMT
jgi:uncharacterized OB-fold protein